MVRNILEGIARICLTRTRPIFLIAILLAVAAIGGASRLRFDPEILNLIPEQNQTINDFKRILTELGTIDYHLVVLKLPEGREADDYETLVDAMGERYRRSNLIEQAMWRLPNPLEMVDEALPYAMLLLPPESLDRVEMQLRDEAIRESVARNKALLQTPQSTAMKEIVRVDPFNLLPIYLDSFRSAGSGFRIDVSSGFYLSEDRTTLLLITKPVRAAQDMAFAREVMELSEAIESEAISEFRDSAGAEVPVPEIVYTGGYAIAFDDAELIRKDIIANILFSFFGVLLLFLYAFRRGMSLVYAGLPMALAILLTFGVAGVIFGELSAASAGFAALLAGLGIDFITVLYERYVEERNRGASVDSAIVTIMRSTLPGVIVAAVTTSATFLAFLATDFRGMSELGLLTGIGILIFLACVTFLMPALLVRSERRATDDSVPRLYLHSFGSERLIGWSLRNSKAVVTIWVVLLLVLGFAATRLQFSDNIQNLRAKGNRGILVQDLVTEKFGQSFDFMMYVIEGPELDSTLEWTWESATDLDALVEEGVIASYQSIATILPPPSRQNEVIARLREGGSAFDVDRIGGTLREALTTHGFREGAYDEYIERFGQALAPESPITLETMENEQFRDFTTRFVKQTSDGRWMSVIYLYPSGGVWPRSVPKPLLHLAESRPWATLTGVNLASEVLRNIVRADAIRATSLSLLIVFALFVIAFRSLWRAMFVFIPFTAGCVAMLGAMSMVGLQFNFMNVFVGLMLIGVATDYAIYMMQRYLERPDAFAETAPETGKAVVMAALTSIVGFGSFAISHYPGLRSIGYAATFGVGFSCLATISLLPAMLSIFRGRMQRRRGAN